MAKTSTRKKGRSPSKQSAPAFQRKFWIGLCVVSSAWMFFFGLMVGRGMIPSLFDIPKLERELADLAQPDRRPDANSEKEAIPKSNIPAADLNKALKAPDPVLNKPPEIPTKAETPAKGALKIKRPLATLQKKKRVKTAKKSNAAASTQEGRLVVQAAAYRNLDAANEAVAALQQMGYRAYVASVEIEGKGIWHRVRLGPFGSKADADRAVQRLKKKKIDGYIIK
jgi:DedD protein